jgi:hypothetical protein
MYFTLEEKKWLKGIVQSYQPNNWKKLRLDNLIKSIFDRVIDINEFFPYFTLKDGESNDPNNAKAYAKAVQEGYFPLAKFVCMLDFLNKKHLILFVPEFKTNCAKIEGCEQSNESEEEQLNETPFFNIEENTIVEFLRKNLNQFVVPTEELINLVKNNFVSDEEKRFKKQQKLTKCGIMVALFVGISSLIINIFCRC